MDGEEVQATPSLRRTNRHPVSPHGQGTGGSEAATTPRKRRIVHSVQYTIILRIRIGQPRFPSRTVGEHK
eukprot:1188825-Prorocentrum_minimum.AAC.2